MSSLTTSCAHVMHAIISYYMVPAAWSRVKHVLLGLVSDVGIQQPPPQRYIQHYHMVTMVSILVLWRWGFAQIEKIGAQFGGEMRCSLSADQGIVLRIRFLFPCPLCSVQGGTRVGQSLGELHALFHGTMT